MLVFGGISSESVLAEAQTLIAHQTAIRDTLVKTITPETATFANTVRPLVDSRNHAASRTTILRSVLAQVHPDKAIRDASRKAQNLVTAAEAANLMRTDVADLISAVHHQVTTGASAEDLDAQDRFLLARIYGQHVRAGASIACPETRQRIREASEELGRLESSSLKCITEENDGAVWCTRDELAGINEDDLKSLKTGTPPENMAGASPRTKQQLFRVPLKGNAFTVVYRSASREETRRRLESARSHRFPENVGRLSRIIVLRDEIARLQGYDNHAAVRMQDKMADSTAEVLTSLQTLRQKLEPIRDADLATLRQMKLEEGWSQGAKGPAHCTSRENSAPGCLLPRLFAWDFTHYSYRWKKEHCSLDMRKFAGYFEVQHIVQGILELYGEVFGLDFVPMPVVAAWHDEVVTYAVRNTAEDGGRFLGYLYLDIIAREGKYSNGTHIAIQRPFVYSLGNHYHGVSTVICAISRSEVSPDEPVLLEHKDVKSLMHEMCHAVHNLVSSAKYGIEHSRDFVEIPSVTMENWAWDPKVLMRLGKHHSLIRTSAQQQQEHDSTEESSGGLPLEIAEGVTRTKWLFRANQMMRSIHLALFDLTIHSPLSAQAAAEIDTTSLWNSTKSEIMGLVLGAGDQDPGWGQASFSHILKKYDAGYFAYALCQVAAADIYDTVFAGDAWDKSAGRKLRRLLLEPGAGLPEAETVQALLGRKPNSDAFLRQILS